MALRVMERVAFERGIVDVRLPVESVLFTVAPDLEMRMTWSTHRLT
jgi:hypothetical protein